MTTSEVHSGQTSKRARRLDFLAAAIVYLATTVPVFAGLPFPVDWSAVVILLVGWSWFYSRLVSYRQAATHWKRRADERYTYQDVQAFLKTSQSHYEPGSAPWMAVDLQVSALRVSLISGEPLAEVDPGKAGEA